MCGPKLKEHIFPCGVPEVEEVQKALHDHTALLVVSFSLMPTDIFFRT